MRLFDRQSFLVAAAFAATDSLGALMRHAGGFKSEKVYIATRKRQKAARLSRRANR
jgi:hypothetical protein